MEVRLLSDGELVCRAPLKMVGYRKDPEKTSETLDSGGWFRTGDIAAIDDEGYVSVVDRKKELIISAVGKNMSPANIESAIKGESSLIGQSSRSATAAATTSRSSPSTRRRPHSTRNPWASRLVLSTPHPRLHEEIDGAVARGNARLNTNEQIKKYRILPEVCNATAMSLPRRPRSSADPSKPSTPARSTICTPNERLVSTSPRS